MERETGIEPATNSLEGCDSTTELLPHVLPSAPARGDADRVETRAMSLPQCHLTLVARGGFEPPKPLGRQIYSLLRLTASLPRRLIRPHVSAHASLTAEGQPGFPCDCQDFALRFPCVRGAGEGI